MQRRSFWAAMFGFFCGASWFSGRKASAEETFQQTGEAMICAVDVQAYQSVVSRPRLVRVNHKPGFLQVIQEFEWNPLGDQITITYADVATTDASELSSSKRIP